VNDGELDSAIATVMLTIIPVNDAPVATAIAATLLEDGRITLNLLGSASDVDVTRSALPSVTRSTASCSRTATAATPTCRRPTTTAKTV